MDRFQAINMLKQKIREKPVHLWARDLGVTVKTSKGTINKGWVGITLNKMIPESEGFRIKSVHGKNGVPSDTMAISMVNPSLLAVHSFEESNVFEKLKTMIFVSHSYLDETREAAEILSIKPFDCTDIALVDGLRESYNKMRLILMSGNLSSNSCDILSDPFLQVRTKGTKRKKNLTACPMTGRLYSRKAFYGTKRLINYIAGNL